MTFTAKEMVKYIGAKGKVAVGNGLYASITVLDVTEAWGNVRFEVQDDYGNVAKVENIRFDAPTVIKVERTTRALATN